MVATVGGGGLEMILGELAALRDLGLAIPILVFADAQLGLIELKQRTSQLPNLAVDFGATDFPAVARALGGEGAAVRDRASPARELEVALASRSSPQRSACELMTGGFDLWRNNRDSELACRIRHQGGTGNR